MPGFDEVPDIIREFLVYHETIKGHSQSTVDEYYLDLRTFFRYIKQIRGYAPDNADSASISIMDIDLDFVKAVTTIEIYDYLNYLSRVREKQPKSKNSQRGIESAARARKISTLRSFFNYLTLKAKKLDENPLLGLDSPKLKKTLPEYLSLDESIQLLSAVQGRNKHRDYCILCIFLNCGLRISEIVKLNLGDIHGDYLRVHGKGNKERVVFLNDICKDAVASYLIIRNGIDLPSENALFLSARKQRISRDAIHHMVKKMLKAAGLDSNKYSAHKLRHTAATLMLKNGIDVRTLQELLGHEHLNTTQIYTHVENTELRIAAEAHPLANIKIDSPKPDD